MRRTPLARGTTPLRRGRVKAKRATQRRREAPRWDVDEWMRQNVVLLDRARHACEACGESFGTDDPCERHHRQRRRDGGDRACNLLMLHASCHKWWTERPAEAIARGIIVPTWKDPADVPVLWRGTEWSGLTDSGTRLPSLLPADYRLVG